jgi:hypothetical protein
MPTGMRRHWPLLLLALPFVFLLIPRYTQPA